MEQEQDRDQRDDDDLLQQCVPDRGDGSLDQVAAVVPDLESHTWRQTLLQAGEFGADVVDGHPGVLAETHHDDAPDGLSLAARGIVYLRTHPRENGRWKEEHWTGTGFPQVFMLKYHGYAAYFPLWAVARYRNLMRGNSRKVAHGL